MTFTGDLLTDIFVSLIFLVIMLAIDRLKHMKAQNLPHLINIYNRIATVITAAEIIRFRYDEHIQSNYLKRKKNVESIHDIVDFNEKIITDHFFFIEQHLKSHFFLFTWIEKQTYKQIRRDIKHLNEICVYPHDFTNTCIRIIENSQKLKLSIEKRIPKILN